MPTYEFKPRPEMVWFVVTAMAAAALQMVSGAPPEDYRLWAISVAVAMVRAGLGAALHVLNNISSGPGA